MRLRNYHFILALLINSLFFYNLAFSNSTEFEDKNCHAIENFHKRAVCLKERLLETEKSEEKAEYFKLFIDYWKNRDGAQGYTMSDIFLCLLEHDPDFFLSQMVNYREYFDEWIDELLSLSFTWYDESPSPLPQKREKFIQLLHEYIPEKKDIQELKDRLLSKLISLTPEQIQ